jgi:hypothetical protein
MFDEWDSLASGLSQLGLDLSGNPSGGTSGYYDPSTSAIPDSAFGQIPVTPWTLAAALTVAVLICGSIGYVSYRYSEQAASIATKQHALDLLAQGKLTPAETLQVIQGASVPASGGIFDSIRGTAGWLAVGALAVFVVPEIIKVFERRR